MQSIKVGRNPSPENDIVIPNDPYVGRHHCQFVKDDNGDYWVIDLNSTNGTYINGVRCAGTNRLNCNDVVCIGNTILHWKEFFPSEIKKDNVIEKSDLTNESNKNKKGKRKEKSRENRHKPDNKIDDSTNEKSSPDLSAVIFFCGLISLGLIVYVVVNYFTSLGLRLGVALGGDTAIIKLFPHYIRGYYFTNGQWMPLIIAVVLGYLTDILDFITGEKDSKLTTAGQEIGNIGASIGVVFIVWALFA